MIDYEKKSLVAALLASKRRITSKSNPFSHTSLQAPDTCPPIFPRYFSGTCSMYYSEADGSIIDWGLAEQLQLLLEHLELRPFYMPMP